MLFTRLELPFRLDNDFSDFFDNILDSVRQEVVEGVDLLGYKTILMEKSVYNLPGILLVDFSEFLV